VIFLVTYRRPLLAKRFFDAAVATGMKAPGVMLVQGDAAGYDFPLPPGWVRGAAKTNMGLIKGLNACYAQHKDAAWFGLVADDLIPQTQDWDTKLLAQMHPMGIVSCSDGNYAYQGGRVCGATFLSGDLVRAQGFIGPPCCWHSYTDDWLELVAKTFPCWNRVDDVIVRHDTPVFGNRPTDETHDAAYGPGREMRVLHEDQAKYAAWLPTEGMAAMGRIAVERANRRA